MAIMLREFIGDNNFGDNAFDNMPLDLNESNSSALAAPSPETLMVDVEAIHTLRTKNFTRYTPQALKESQKYWSSPYLKPVILHHNDQTGRIIGRIYHAEYKEQTDVEGAGGLELTLSIPDEQAAKDVKNRILETVSIGVSADDVRCSICGEKITDNSGCPNGHERGAMYENEVCCWDIYSFQPKEISYVIVPSDIYAKNKRVYLAKEASKNHGFVNKTFNESADNNIKSNNGDKLKNMDLEKQLSDAQEQIKTLQADLEQAKAAGAELEALKAKKEEAEKKIKEIEAVLEGKDKEMKATIEGKDKQIEDEKQKLVISEEKLAEAEKKITALTQEKEAAVEAGLAAKEQLRAFACNTLNKYREMSGREIIAQEMLEKRSIDSILDSVLDLSEDFKEYKPAELKKTEEPEDPADPKLDLGEGQIPNPVAPTNPTPNRKEENKNDYRNINLSEGLLEIFTEAAKLK